MMTLEQRARSAADAVHASTSAYVPRSGVADVARRRARRRAGLVAAAGIAVFVALLAGTWMVGPSIDDEVAEPPAPTVPDIEEPIVEPPPAPIVPGPREEPQNESVDPSPADEPVAPPTEQVDEPDGGVVALPPVTEPPPSVTAAPPETVPTVPADTTPPRLTITSPEDGHVSDSKTIRFTGTTEPGAVVTAGRFEADVDDKGNWSIVLVLNDGGNRARFTATDAAGNETTVGITVYFEEPKEEPPPPDWVFTAHATYGSCSFDPPYDVYHGTAKPGTKVLITSEFGGGHVYADDGGHWELKVFFPEAPYNVGFLVKVRDEFGNQKSFEFVSLVPPPAD